MTKTTLEILKGARELLSDPVRWHQGGYYYERDTGPCYCILGAVNLVANGPDPHYPVGRRAMPIIVDTTEDKAMEAMAECVPEQFVNNHWKGKKFASIAAFNDDVNTTHEDVLKALDCAIARLEAPIS